jgi:ribosomal protein L12E/L44/L45/RPP1/RPP2
MVKQLHQYVEPQGQLVDIADVDDLLGPPPLLPSESVADYEGLRARLRAKIVPRDVVEEIWLRDILDLQWEVLRMRRLKSRILSSGRPTGLQSLLDRRVVCYELSKLVDGLGRGEKETIKQIEKVLKQFGLSVDDIDAHTLLKTLDPLERIDRTISHAESRRNNAVREIEKSRDATARRMRMALSEEDASPSSLEVQETSA